jgi:hypothetical protein
MIKQTLKTRVHNKIKRSRWNVFQREDFKKLADYDQVGRALLNLTREGYLKKIGYGLYAKARVNRITGGSMLAADGGFVQVAEEACQRLGLNWRRSEAFQAYAMGSTQIPANAEVLISGRCSRKIATDKYKLTIRKMKNDRSKLIC